MEHSRKDVILKWRAIVVVPNEPAVYGGLKRNLTKDPGLDGVF